MPNDPTILQLKRKFARKARLERFSALLADNNGVIYEPGLPGYVRVRQYGANGQLSAPFAVRSRGMVNMLPNRPVQLGYDETDRLCIVSADFDGIIAQNASPLTDNASDPNVYSVSNQSQIIPLVSSPTNPASTNVRVVSWIYYDGDASVYQFTGALVDLSSYIPTSGNHRLAGLFLKYDRTIEVKTSTTKSTSDPISIDDASECYLARSPGSKAVWFWRLHDNQASITNADSFLDGRQFIAPDNPALYATVQTTDATVTTLASISVAEGRMITVKGMVNGLRSTFAEAIGGSFMTVFRRGTGGNVVIVGAPEVHYSEDSSGSPIFNLDADTSTQTARIRVTGEAAKTFNWSVKYEVLRS